MQNFQNLAKPKEDKKDFLASTALVVGVALNWHQEWTFPSHPRLFLFSLDSLSVLFGSVRFLFCLRCAMCFFSIV